MTDWPRPRLPRGLYGRAALILIVPIVTIQLLVSIAFLQRHFEGVTRQMTEGVEAEIRAVLAETRAVPPGDWPGGAVAAADRLAAPMRLRVTDGAGVAPGDRRVFWDISGRTIIATLHADMPEVRGVDLTVTDPVTGRREVRVLIDAGPGPLAVVVDRRRLSASNPHQLLVLMIGAGILLTVIAYIFLRAQLRPIKRLADAAEAFGKGRVLPYKPRGAQEVRAAGAAFVEMRARIERQIEQRTLLLSGVSHDLRTPLTRLKLGLAMLDDGEEVEALSADVAEMERIIDDFLAFARGDATEAAQQTDVSALVEDVVGRARRAGQPVTLIPGAEPVTMQLRPDAVARALGNLIGNAVRHGTRAEVSMETSGRELRLVVEDDGPGIPRERREEALRPFTRLDSARNANRGGGAGLGLAIAADIARSHGGVLRLSDSRRLGGLRAELALAR
ncbi:ATP-binding protein [Ruixingdingia sedimenti]|uniref:histidine kinase n=1 Tax=Ruixingdingia sedimenti TaxID=3073604 RepID=A0ABU1F4N8_9RHOB|nr:ATP-binding protein [Xinfangfangia sp. LG-4]MDR5651830.1 ATP-binding protein [Xinfangfangia sp. LG-4]